MITVLLAKTAREDRGLVGSRHACTSWQNVLSYLGATTLALWLPLEKWGVREEG